MALGSKQTKRCSSLSIDYKQLNELSSVTLYDGVPKGKRGRLHEVERILIRRKIRHGHEYLLKWKGWPFHYCSWEPSEHLTPNLLRSYLKPPKPDSVRLEIASRDFLIGIQACLKGKSMAPASINMDLDVWRFLTSNRGMPSEHKCYTLYEKEDFNRFETLPSDWYYLLNGHGEGKAIDFPIKARPTVSSSKLRYHHSNGKLQKSPIIPIEKVSVHILRKACDISNL